MQILSWRLQANYFPYFTSAEACEQIIKMANSKLEPSKLPLREGKTIKSTKGTRIRYCHEPCLFGNILPLDFDSTLTT